MSDKQFWLCECAEDMYGNLTIIEQADGPHSDMSGVVKAERIIKGLKFLSKKNTKFYAITIEDVPSLEVSINQEAIDTINKSAEILQSKKEKCQKYSNETTRSSIKQDNYKRTEVNS